ncbi:Uncharacterized protein APZ42_032421 [Daphnia magna]|uniref:Reverse transcriptase domain-containing protein n=1 Tax=Daphnia magna TaxID=35525 RepID=A0A164M039_9CRUS|nr:Uncharacterized protein APZ42_032421 [Daphnia magna]
MMFSHYSDIRRQKCAIWVVLVTKTKTGMVDLVGAGVEREEERYEDKEELIVGDDLCDYLTKQSPWKSRGWMPVKVDGQQTIPPNSLVFVKGRLSSEVSVTGFVKFHCCLKLGKEWVIPSSVAKISNRIVNIATINYADVELKLRRRHFMCRDARPVKSYRVSVFYRQIIADKVEEMLEEESFSPRSSPVVLVRKVKLEDYHFCVDFRRVNALTKRDVYPLPRIQGQVAAEDREKTAFVTPDGLYQFTRLPFGLNNAPATFQRLMDLVLAGLKWHMGLVYLDDILVFGRTFEEHLARLELVLTALERANLTLNIEKCVFGEGIVSHLGHVIDAEGIRPQNDKHPIGQVVSRHQPIETPSSPFELVRLDHLGPFKTTSSWHQHVMVLIDYLTKWIEVAAVPDTSTTTEVTPFELVNGHAPILPVENLVPWTVEDRPELHAQFLTRVSELRNGARLQIIEKQRRVKERVDRQRKAKIEFYPGDLVLIRRHLHKASRTKKLLPKFVGPFQVVRKLSPSSYLGGSAINRNMIDHKSIMAIPAALPKVCCFKTTFFNQLNPFQMAAIINQHEENKTHISNFIPVEQKKLYVGESGVN